MQRLQNILLTVFFTELLDLNVFASSASASALFVQKHE